MNGMSLNQQFKTAVELMETQNQLKKLKEQKNEMLGDIQSLLFAEEPHKIAEKLFLLWDKYRRDK